MNTVPTLSTRDTSILYYSIILLIFFICFLFENIHYNAMKREMSRIFTYRSHNTPWGISC